ncbi:DUF72 domain-containing protein [Runella sp. SP2]|uniref:DUF72 domain-containing protein n=1 Tax=Runella sp. SP2 TaxID=2268026 RepID=UPI000F08A75E|nr:DUF72 domain-containing protein [Runella sp. SP2]AYQ32853.1 DUF72 domain-containing protein [Runella sp. SP2]
MDFGKLTDISGVNFALPNDPVFNQGVLNGTVIAGEKQVFVGPPIWANKEWVGKIYPTTAKEKDFLYHYGRQFNTIELNVTHYQIPSESTIQRWKESVPTHFKFCPKWPQEISHDRQLRGCEPLSDAFTKSVLGLEANLGMTFLQLGPYFDPRQSKILTAFLKQLPPKFPIAVEFRHPDWFAQPLIWEETLQMLHELGVGTVMSDVAGRRDVVHMGLSNSTVTLRFVGNELHPTDYSRVDEWVQRLKNWFEKGLSTAYIFVHCGENLHAPELSSYWIEQINKHCHFTLLAPRIQPKVIQGSLF